MKDVELDKRKAGEIEYFFTSYNKLAGKKFKVGGRSGTKKAMAIVRQYEVKTFQE